MDKTAIQSGEPLAKAPETGFQPGAPAAPPPTASVSRALKHPAHLLLERLASLRITVVLFAMSLLLVFWGTLAQVDAGVWTVVAKYFRTFFVMVPLRTVLFNSIPMKDNPFSIPYPGGLLLGTVMLINLLAAHAIRFKFTWNRAGIILIHVGIIIMMLSEVVTYKLADEGSMIIPLGRTINYVVHTRQTELAVIKHISDKKDEVVVIPANLLRIGAKISDPDLPFEFEVIDYMVNSRLVDPDPKRNRATVGLGLHEMVLPVSEVSGVDPNQTHDTPAAYVRVTYKGKDLGVYLFTVWFSETHLQLKQEITLDEKDRDNTTYEVVLRFKQSERPFSLTLTHFQQEFWPGTKNPKDYRSFVTLNDHKNNIVPRKVEIYMNAPLSYAGETFYQSSVNSDGMGGPPTGTTLQVVRNPGWLMPYISCFVVGIGLLMHFGITLTRFISRRTVR